MYRTQKGIFVCIWKINLHIGKIGDDNFPVSKNQKWPEMLLKKS